METDKKREFKKVYYRKVKDRSDKMMNRALMIYFAVGILLGLKYDTVDIALMIGGSTLLCYWFTKLFLYDTETYQYLTGVVLGIFMAQFIFQMHGMFEMHFVAFIGSVLMITYQNWKMQISLFLFVLIHHTVFGYLQFSGFHDIYFTQQDYMDLNTFLIHMIFATVIFSLSAVRAHNYRLMSDSFINQSFEIGRLQAKEIENTELKKVNEELDRFVYSVSHDLRAPLTGMLGVIMLAEKDEKDSKNSDYFRLLKCSVKRLDCFISDILDYSRNSRLERRPEVVDFKSILDDVNVSLHAMLGKVEDVKILANINCNHQFKTDKTRLTMVLSNLISNAVRYRRIGCEPSFVKIDIKTNEDGADILVEDNGIGIKEDVQGKVFDMFYRGSDASVGSGLGLYIVKEALDKLNASIKLTSVVGKGTKFAIHLPTL
ncbi:MAG TPA: HAMP domain-containing sensor histidine kinase [Bacteroidia bacterium]|jgi:signal transduction histidine kinase|nr:HAMP domain-containing sensor histidine kinase [Bacteroidia bacterium]HQK97915.1 HAMP domain-containing sensor histidine kinase [Bacteroidia bacterium]